MDDVGNGRIETGNSILNRTPGYPGPEPDGYPVPKISESPSTVTMAKAASRGSYLFVDC